VLKLNSLIVIVLTLLSSAAQARKFDMKNEVFATYFGGGFGPSNVSDHAFGMAAGTGVQTDQLVRSNFSGEFGVLFAISRFNVRLAGEYLVGRALTGVKGNSGTTEFYELDSKITAFVPMALIETEIWSKMETRLVLGGGLGMASVSLDQEYEMTAAGVTGLGVASYIEKASASVSTWRAYIGGETLFVDTTTVALELGYRELKVGALQSTKDTTSLTGSQTTGTTLINMDGSPRSFDLGGAYANIYFRFYL
jgi:hypothetical protein